MAVAAAARVIRGDNIEKRMWVVVHETVVNGWMLKTSL